MPVQKLSDAVETLSPDEQSAVLQFIEYLKRRSPQQNQPFLAAVDEFIEQHPELLRRLAQ